MKSGNIQPRPFQECLPAIALYLFSLIHVPAVCGQSSLKGVIWDSLLNKHCAAAVVMVLQPDSTIVQFTRSTNEGRFYFKDLASRNYLLFVSHPSCSPIYLQMELKAGEARDIGTLTILPRAEILAAAIVMPRVSPPHMRGDTLEYNTSGIKTRVNATVEELLNHLPGVQIDRNGVITVNGQRVERLLVDGEDFFSSDPTIVTRNLNADMIAKVQVLNRRSDQTRFTGVDDGQRIKTLNLTLKEDSKHSYFVKTGVSGSGQGYYNGNSIAGGFNGTQQFGVLAAINNTGSGNPGDDESGLTVDGPANDALGASAGTGIPRILAAGTHFSDHWNSNDAHANGNYKYGQLLTRPVSRVINRQVLPDSIYMQTQESSSSNYSNQHNFDAGFNFKPDSISALQILLHGSDLQNQGTFMSFGSSSMNDVLVNNNLRIIHSDAQNRNFQGTVMWNRRTGKKSNSNVSIVAGISKRNGITKGYVYSKNDFFGHDTTELFLDTTDQRKRIGTDEIILTNDISYSLPLRKDVVLASTYGLSYDGNNSYQETFDRGDGKYQTYVDSFSSHYRNDVTIQRMTVNLQIHNKTLLYCTIGGDVQHYNFKQRDLRKKDDLGYRYVSFSPRLKGSYAINSTRGINFDYNGRTNAPSITQLQPVQNNNDPLHLIIGNPDLRPGFTHNLNLLYYIQKSFAFNFGVNVGVTTKSISTKISTDNLGRQVSQAVNVAGNRNAGILFIFTNTLKPIGLYASIQTRLSYSRDFNYVNQYFCKTDNYQLEVAPSLAKRVEDKYVIRLNYRVAYLYSGSSINLSSSLHYWTQNLNAQISVYVLCKAEISTGILYDWRQKVYELDKKNASLLWNARISRDFFNNRLKVRWQISDILGKNTGISRQTTANQITESMSNVIGRYWMLGIGWRFTHSLKRRG